MTIADAPLLSLHALQALPPSLINAGVDSNPKQIVFGDGLRQRISSQSQRRALRTHMRQAGVAAGNFAMRTAHLPRMIAAALVEHHGRDADEATARTADVFGKKTGIDVSTKPSGDTSVMLFVPEGAELAIAKVIDAYWDETTVGEKLPAAMLKDVLAAFDKDRCGDLAVFGRFLPELDGMTIDSALQVAEALGTDTLVDEIDFFTAVDDRAQVDEHLAGHLGRRARTTGIFYRLAVLDRLQLRANLKRGGLSEAEVDAFADTVEQALIEAFTLALPKAGASATSPYTLPALVLAHGAKRQENLSDAFLTRTRAALPGDDVLALTAAKLLAQHARASRFVTGRSALMPVTISPEQLAAAKPLDGLNIVSSYAELSAATR